MKKRRSSKPGMRLEKDSIGAKEVPAAAYHGIFTRRALENFPISRWHPDPAFIRAIAAIKLAAARANAALGVLDSRIAAAIEKAARELLDGKHEGECALDVFTAGAGTPFNMCVNEVLANRAAEILEGVRGRYDMVHPNDHVNLGQSSNDVIPTATRLSALMLLEEMLPAVRLPERSLRGAAARYRGLLKSSRTHLQDAVPITMGQELAASAESMRKGARRILEAADDVRLLGIGGTAVGTGINTHPRFAALVVRNLREITGLRLGRARDLVEATASMADLLALSNAIEEHAVELNRISNDLRLLASGPGTGLNEVRLPEVEPGSSIMPGKVNPSVPEMVNMVCFQVLGNAVAIRHAAAGGQLDLNVFTPTIAFNLNVSIRILGNASRVLAERCIDGLEVNEDVCRRHLERSAGIATALTPAIGYSRAAELVKKALAEGRSVRKVLLAESGLGAREIASLLDARSLTRPNLRPRRKGRRT